MAFLGALLLGGGEGDAFEVSRKNTEKPKFVTENEPNMDEPTTTTVDNLGKKFLKFSFLPPSA